MFEKERCKIALCLSLLAGLVLSSAGCMEEYDFERPEYERGTLGEELYAIWHRDAERSPQKPERKTRMLEERREVFIDGVDAVAPPPRLERVDQFLRNLMTLVDDGLLQGMTRKLGLTLENAASDQPLLEALAVEDRPRPGDFLSPVNGKNFIGHLMSYERLDEVATGLTELLLAADGLDRHGRPDGAESTALTDLVDSLHIGLAQTERSDPTDGLVHAMKRVFADEDDRFQAVDAGAENVAVVYDRRGLPKVPLTPDGVARPFVDEDGDGLADVDDRGRFILENGQAQRVAPFLSEDDEDLPLKRDEYGRGLLGDDFIFAYIDLNQTGLDFAMRTAGELVERDSLWHLVGAAPALLGERETKSDERGSFEGYSDDNPLTDIAYAALHILDIDRLDMILSSLAEFIDRHSSQLAGLFFAFEEAVEVLDEHPDAEMSDEQTVAYDLLPLLEQLAEDPQLWRDFFWALRQPMTRNVGEPMHTLVNYRDQNPAVPQLQGVYDSCFQDCKERYPIFDPYREDAPRTCRERYRAQDAQARYECIRDCDDSEIFSEPTDFDAPESPSNRSMLQRLFHLLRDTAGTPYQLDIVAPGWLSGIPPIIQLDGSAEAFINSIASNLDLADYVPDLGSLQPLVDFLGEETVAGIISALTPLFGTELGRRPTPDQITRLFNMPELSAEVLGVNVEVDPPVCKDDYVMADHHADILYASEASGLIDTLAPISCAFSHHGREDLLAEMFVVVHDHYSGRDDLYETADGHPSPMKGANLVSYEPAMAEILARGTAFEALYELSVAVDEFKSADDVDLVEQLRRLVHNAARSDDGFRARDGRASLELADGRILDRLSRLHVLADAAEQMSERLDGDPEAQESLEALLSALYDVLLTANWDAGERAGFEEEGTVAIGSKLLRHLAQRARQARQEGRLSQWLTGEQMERVEAMWDSRFLPALVDLSEELASTDEGRQLADGLFDHLIGSADGREQATMAAYVLMVYTLNQDVWVPLSHRLAEVIDPQRSWEVEPYGDLPMVSHLLQLLHDAVEADDAGEGIAMLERGFSNRPDGSVPFVEVFATVAHYFRFEPDAQAPYDADDYGAVFEGFVDWLGDEKHGLERLYELVSRRTTD